jgi:type VII secretion protein EccB
MSTKRDLVEAHNFNRRRLVTAFVSGAPGGREVEPVRPGRTLVGGLVLAALVVAGGAVAGFLKPTLPDDWLQSGLVIGEDSGARFLAYDGRLYPVINTTSARLLLPPEEFEVMFVPDDAIAQQSPGATIGIPGAPDVLPEPGRLIQGGWTACSDMGGSTSVALSGHRTARFDPGAAQVVESAGEVYVVTGQHRYPVPARHRDAVLRALGLDGETPRPVPGVWLDLLPLGSPLRPFTVPGSGESASARAAVPGVVEIGSVVRVGDSTYVLMRHGLAPLGDFAAALYTSAGAGAGLPEIVVEPGRVAGVPTVEERPFPEDWPTRLVSASDAEVSCVVLATGEGEVPKVRLAEPVGAVALPTGDGSDDVRVDSGSGALFRAVSGGVLDRGTIYLVDSSGIRFAVGTPLGETLDRLGYGGVAPVPVPQAWADLFSDGPVLDADHAARPAGAGS